TEGHQPLPLALVESDFFECELLEFRTEQILGVAARRFDRLFHIDPGSGTSSCEPPSKSKSTRSMVLEMLISPRHSPSDRTHARPPLRHRAALPDRGVRHGQLQLEPSRGGLPRRLPRSPRPADRETLLAGRREGESDRPRRARDRPRARRPLLLRPHARRAVYRLAMRDQFVHVPRAL